MNVAEMTTDAKANEVWTDARGPVKVLAVMPGYRPHAIIYDRDGEQWNLGPRRFNRDFRRSQHRLPPKGAGELPNG